MKSCCPILKIPTTARIQQRHFPHSAPRLLKPRLGTVPGHGVQEMLHVMWACKDKYSQASAKYVILVIPNILNLNKS